MIIDFPWQSQHVLTSTPDSADQQARCSLSINTIQDAQGRYQQALAELTLQPTNPTLKQRALLHGRTYALLTHLCADPTLRRHDECALLNDIMAAAAMDPPASGPYPH